jgi:serine protease
MSSARCVHRRIAFFLAFALALPVGAAANERLIVKLKPDAAKSALLPKAHIQKIAHDAGGSVSYVRAMALDAHVVAIDGNADASAARALAARLAADPAIEYAQRDERRKALQTNDQYVSTQHYLTNDPASMSAYAAWAVTTGSTATVVAVIDTGYRPHGDLQGRVLAGYDMIHDPLVANDGDGRDRDATDPGDYLLPAEIVGEFVGCPVEFMSSWHGTSVAGIIAATANNGIWLAGIDWNARVLPVRVLGKCGGYDSDILDGIVWAAGLPVPGAPFNPTPAQVINLSLGGTGACTPAYTAAFDAALAFGVVRAIVAAAGNSAEDVSNHTPASCKEVIAVASTTYTGLLARYSNFGAGVAVSAPGGTINFNLPDEGIFVLSNSGTTTPNGPPPFGDTIKTLGGTSFAAPMVTGTISLMLAVAPYLTASQIRQIITTTAKPFPQGSDCTTARCGAGILDAGAAVQAAKATPPPPVLNVDQHGLTGSWFQAATSGQGMELEFFVDAVAVGTAYLQGAWFTFDAAAVGGVDHQRWYTFSGNAQTGAASIPVTIFQNTGGNFNAPPVTQATPVGIGILEFDDCTNAAFGYVFNDGSGRNGVIPLTRLTPNVTCSAVGASKVTNPDFGFSGNWYDTTTSGQGFVVELNPLVPLVFLTWYTYAPNGQAAGASGQRWFTGQASYTPGARVLPMTLYETTGGLFDAPTNPAPQTVAVGTATLTFASCTAAKIQFNFTSGGNAGKSGTIQLARVGPTPAGCGP